MTNNNIKDNKTKTVATITLALTIGLVILSPTMIMPSVSAQLSHILTTGNVEPPKRILDPVKQSYFDNLKKYWPKSLSVTDLANAEKIALSDQKVKEMIGGKPVKLMSHGFSGNLKTTPVVWYPRLDFNVGNKTQIVVVVNPSTNKTTEVLIGPPIGVKFTTSPPQSKSSDIDDDYYNSGGTNYDIAQGLTVDTNSPSFTSSSSYNDTGFMLNAEATSSTGSLCDSGNSYGYVMQAGLDFGTSHPVDTFWTDTYNNCQAQGTSISYSAGDTYEFSIVPDPSNFSWDVTVEDVSTQNTDVTPETVVYSPYTIETNVFDTSVWFENNNTSTSTPDWSSQFGSSPKASGAEDELNGAWGYWGSDTQEDYNCKGQSNDNPPSGYGIISNNLQSGNQATWSLSTMAQKLPAC